MRDAEKGAQQTYAINYGKNVWVLQGMNKVFVYFCLFGYFLQDYLDFIIFPEDVITSEPVEKWPLCDCLIGFHSTDFPLRKAIEYEKLRRPFVMNDLNRQFDLVCYLV